MAYVGGTVTAGGSPLAGVRVVLFGDASAPLATAVTDATGRYDAPPLPPGDYAISFSTSQVASALGALPRYLHGDGLVTEGPGRGPPLTLAAGDTRTGLDIDLPVGAAIVGRVTDDQGRPVAGALVSIHFDPNHTGMWTVTDDTGAYRLRSLATGSYRVWANGPHLSGLLDAYHGARTFADAAFVAVTEGHETGGIDITLPSLLGSDGTPTFDPAPATPLPAALDPRAVLATRALSVRPSGAIALTLRCVGPSSCSGTARLSTRGGTVLGRAGFTVASASTRRVALRLDRAARRFVRRQGRLPAMLTLTLGARTTRQAVTLRRR